MLSFRTGMAAPEFALPPTDISRTGTAPQVQRIPADGSPSTDRLPAAYPVNASRQCALSSVRLGPMPLLEVEILLRRIGALILFRMLLPGLLGLGLRFPVVLLARIVGRSFLAHPQISRVAPTLPTAARARRSTVDGARVTPPRAP